MLPRYLRRRFRQNLGECSDYRDALHFYSTCLQTYNLLTSRRQSLIRSLMSNVLSISKKSYDSASFISFAQLIPLQVTRLGRTMRPCCGLLKDEQIRLRNTIFPTSTQFNSLITNINMCIFLRFVTNSYALHVGRICMNTNSTDPW